MSRRIVLASDNRGKLAELSALLVPHGWELVPQSALGVAAIEETGTTFLDNALAKARHAARMTGLAALADDSGLEVDALGGAPGVRSARYAGEGARDADNVARLLDALRGLPPAQRGARFRCVLVFLRHADDPQPLVCEGVWAGRIAEEPRGMNGFGYDPVFFLPQHGCTAAELAPQVKNRLSHRGQALAALLEKLPAL
ncbi:MAG TPA: RdgB/HAM1 family non-canonical purine NTP pyrophosphatase [Gammaproteobacteria bacterium]|nr:RdgB/HAM1 family non-canonical purine NTP pyrophosphatase [Gammaproteobacteria bacterium]